MTSNLPSLVAAEDAARTRLGKGSKRRVDVVRAGKLELHERHAEAAPGVLQILDLVAITIADQDTAKALNLSSDNLVPFPSDLLASLPQGPALSRGAATVPAEG